MANRTGFIVFLIAAMALIGTLIGGSAMTDNQARDFQTLAGDGAQVAEVQSSWGQVATTVDTGKNWIETVGDNLLWDNPMFEGAWKWVSIVILIPISAAFIVSIALAFRGVPS